MNLIRTLRECDKIARQLGIKRGAGTYNGLPYWKNKFGHILTRSDLETMAIAAGLA